MASSGSGKYIRGLTKLKFRDKASIKLPKTGNASVLNRETCYKIAIDVIIESVTKPEYRNFQTTPYHGFYGYATLVMRDCIAPKIQLQFGRNRIFEQRIVEAFQGWNELAFYLQTTKRFLELLANSLRTGEPPSFINNLCDVEAFSVAWSEIDLREVYVLCPEKTQFRIELSWISPEKFTDDCGKEQDGKSKEPDDEEKDDGLPPAGTQPKKNDASDPFGGNTPFTPLGADSPYFNPKGDELNNPDPSNSAPDPFGNNENGVSYNVTISFGVDYVNGSGATVGSSTGQVYFAVVIGKITSISSASPATVFGGNFIGVVSSQIIIVAQNGTLSGQLNNTNINPPFSSQFGASSWKLNGIDGFSIVPN